CYDFMPIGRLNQVEHIYEVNFTTENFFTGCSPFEALIQSTLGCFYNQTCLNEIKIHLTSTFLSASNGTSAELVAMNQTYRWSNETTETIESIVNRFQLGIE
ncbi:unnamed protein product, partial [Rotaria sp. Silwood1]